MIAQLLFLSFTALAASSEIPERRSYPESTRYGACQDFHKYVCDEAEKNFQLRPDRSRHLFAFMDSRERLLEKKKNYFKNEFAKVKNLDPRAQQIQDYFISCMDPVGRSLGEKQYIHDLKIELAQVKTWPELVKFLNSKQDIFDGFVSYDGRSNPENPDKNDVLVYSSLMRLPDHKYYEDVKVTQDFVALMSLFLRAVDPTINPVDAKKRAMAQLDLDRKFIKVFPEAAARRDRWSVRASEKLSTIANKYPALDLKELLKNTPEGLNISMPIPETFQFIEENKDLVSLQAWKDYLLYENLSGLIDDSNPSFQKAFFRFQKKHFGGPAQRSDRLERCTEEASGHFYKEFDAHYLPIAFPAFDEKPVYELGEKIRQSIISGLKKNQWLTSSGKREAIRKIEKATLQLVKPKNDREWDFRIVGEYSKSNYIQNRITYSQLSKKKMEKDLAQPINKDAWGMGPLTVNAYYSPTENKFVLPLGILQYPFYDAQGSQLENLGAVGAVFAHELGHSIDDSGSKYDSEGRLNNILADADLKQFNLRSEKLVTQFNKAQHDGKFTLGENTADLVGVTFSLQAAFNDKQLSDPTPEDTIQLQKFFKAYGRLWCEVARPDYLKLARKTDPHASGEARINEQIKLQPTFKKAFSCKDTDPMVIPAENFIQIW